MKSKKIWIGMLIIMFALTANAFAKKPEWMGGPSESNKTAKDGWLKAKKEAGSKEERKAAHDQFKAAHQEGMDSFKAAKEKAKSEFKADKEAAKKLPKEQREEAMKKAKEKKEAALKKAEEELKA